jgi:2-dehydropantoate 2-reductase
MKVLILGAGVIGSFNAARLTAAGQDITLLARGRRLADLREHGVVLDDFRTGKRTTTRVPLVEGLEPDNTYDLAIVAVRRNQIPLILPTLAKNHRIPAVLFVGNNAGGPQAMIEALGRKRVLMALPNVGGTHQGYVVCYFWLPWFPLLFGELDDVPTPRTQAIVRLFGSAGLRSRVVKNVDAYLKTHAAALPALTGAVYLTGGRVRQFADSPQMLKPFLQGFREALHALRAVGVPTRPSFERLVEWVPEPILFAAMRRLFKSRMAKMMVQKGLDTGLDETKILADELRVILSQSSLPSPACDILFAQIDARFQAPASPSQSAKNAPADGFA